MLRIAILSTIVFITLTTPCLSESIKATGNVEVDFLPRGGAIKSINREINSAKQEILVQAYFFTSKPIQKALIEARKRGVKIETILYKNKLPDYISNSGIPTSFSSANSISNRNIIIIDRRTLIIGSFDFTETEDNNVENMLILKDDKIVADKYIKYFDEHKGHSEEYQGK
jgi:phosphatidylserine/phosphatidylglycerophosphate/cardiolipin synthase-like enzyme